MRFQSLYATAEWLTWTTEGSSFFYSLSFMLFGAVFCSLRVSKVLRGQELFGRMIPASALTPEVCSPCGFRATHAKTHCGFNCKTSIEADWHRVSSQSTPRCHYISAAEVMLFIGDDPGCV